LQLFNDVKIRWVLTFTRGLYYKNYGFVIYGKWIGFVVSKCLFYCRSLSLAWTNTLAYYGIRKLRIQRFHESQARKLALLDQVVWRGWVSKSSLVSLSFQTKWSQRGVGEEVKLVIFSLKVRNKSINLGNYYCYYYYCKIAKWEIPLLDASIKTFSCRN